MIVVRGSSSSSSSSSIVIVVGWGSSSSGSSSSSVSSNSNNSSRQQNLTARLNQGHLVGALRIRRLQIIRHSLIFTSMFTKWTLHVYIIVPTTL